jgi:hypothetical protein
MEGVVSEIVYEPAGVHPITRVRSTIVLASRDSLLREGGFSRYEEALDGEAHRLLAEAIAGEWLPIGLAAAHYRACDALGLGASTVVAMGRATNDKIKGTLYGTFIRLFREAGGDPWNVLPHWQRFWTRAYDGGALRVTKLGPKDARVDVLSCSLCASPYFRFALRGLAIGFIEVFCNKAYASEISANRRDSVSYRFQWA